MSEKETASIQALIEMISNPGGLKGIVRIALTIVGTLLVRNGLFYDFNQDGTVDNLDVDVFQAAVGGVIVLAVGVSSILTGIKAKWKAAVLAKTAEISPHAVTTAAVVVGVAPDKVVKNGNGSKQPAQ